MHMESRIEAVIPDEPAPSPAPRAQRRRWLIPFALSALIACWQFSFNSASMGERGADAMTASMGMSDDALSFFYFFHHYGVFPVCAVDVPRLGPSKQAAD